MYGFVAMAARKTFIFTLYQLIFSKMVSNDKAGLKGIDSQEETI